MGQTKAINSLLLVIVTGEENGHVVSWQLVALAALIDALDQRGQSLFSLRAEGDNELQFTINRTWRIFDEARFRLAHNMPLTQQIEAVRLLGRDTDHRKEDLKTLANLLVPQTPDELQTAVIASLGRMTEPAVPKALLSGWKAYGPSLRGQVLDSLLRRNDWTKAALDAVEKKEILPFEIDAIRRQRLLAHRSSEVRDRAAKLLAGAINPDRQKLIAEYRPALNGKADQKHGAELFAKTCANCHRFNNIGHEVGPDIVSIGDKSPDGLLIAILDPNRAVEAKYINYFATTKNGLTYTGILASETGNSVTLLGPEGKKQVILRTDLESLTSTDKSAMPEGIEKDHKPQDVADIIAYVRAGLPATATKRKEFPGNKPGWVRAGQDGSFQLLATNCEIYGTTLVLETKYANLGWWSSADDKAVWQVEVAKAGDFAVELEYACEDKSAGNRYVLQVDTQELKGHVAGTKDWDTYHKTKIGEVTLPVGRMEISFRAEGKINYALIDLKAIRLIPITK
jgi:putative heme-binding domain-containing protein